MNVVVLNNIKYWGISLVSPEFLLEPIVMSNGMQLNSISLCDCWTCCNHWLTLLSVRMVNLRRHALIYSFRWVILKRSVYLNICTKLSFGSITPRCKPLINNDEEIGVPGRKKNCTRTIILLLKEGSEKIKEDESRPSYA